MKKTLCLFIVGLFCILLTACGGKTDDFSETSQTDDPTVETATAATEAVMTESSTETTDEEVQTTESATKIWQNEWAFAYNQYLLSKYQKAKQAVENGEDEYMPYSRFLLCYMDSDSTPEIMIMEDGSHAGTATILTYVDGAVKSFEGLGSFGVVYFKPKENIIIGDYVGMGTFATTVYHLGNGNLVVDWEGKREGGYMEGDDYSYYSYDRQIDEAEYNKLYAQYVPDWYDPFNDEAYPSTAEDDEWVMLEPKDIEEFFDKWTVR